MTMSLVVVTCDDVWSVCSVGTRVSITLGRDKRIFWIAVHEWYSTHEMGVCLELSLGLPSSYDGRCDE